MPTNPLDFGKKGVPWKDPRVVPMTGNEPTIQLAASTETAGLDTPPKPPKQKKKKGGTKAA